MNILSIKDCNKTITLISKAGKQLDERIHIVGVSGIAHFLQHGDLTILTGLTHSMPKSARGNALKLWITKYVKVKWNAKAYEGKGGWVKNGTPELSEDDKQEIIQTAYDNPFYDKKDTEASVFNPNASILNLVKKLNAYKQEHSLEVNEDVKRALMLAVG